MPASAISLLTFALLATAAVNGEETRMILTGYYDSECLNPLPQSSKPNPQICPVDTCCTRGDGTTSLKLISCGMFSRVFVAPFVALYN